MTSDPTRPATEPSHALVPILDRAVGESVNAVDARELHRALGIGRDFSNWIRSRVGDLQLQKGSDYEVFAKPGENLDGGRPRSEWIVTLDAAKHIAMAERSDRGREIRSYFIACEKKLRTLAATPAPAGAPLDLRDPMQAVALLAQSLQVLEEERTKRLAAETKVEEQRVELAAAAPKVAALERISYSSGALCITDAAKALQIAPSTLFELLQTRQWIYKRPRGRTWLGYQSRVAQGYLVHKVWTGIRESDGEEITRERVLVTPAGLARLAEILGREVEA